MEKAIYLDCDGTFIDFYGVENWLDDLINKSTRPYKVAKPLVNLSLLARLLNQLQIEGYHIGIITWTSKNASLEFHKRIAQEKRKWLNKHLSSVLFNEIKIVPYGTPKYLLVDYKGGILFDDEEKNRNEWLGISYSEKELISELKKLLQ